MLPEDNDYVGLVEIAFAPRNRMSAGTFGLASLSSSIPSGSDSRRLRRGFLAVTQDTPLLAAAVVHAAPEGILFKIQTLGV